MLLHTREWGSGDRVAVLIHGIMADSRCWWRVGPALAERGYRVIAVDLPGHGDSPRAERYTPELYASSVLESVPARPGLAIGHSLGGLTLAVAVERLKPGRAVYADPGFRLPQVDGVDLGAMMAAAKDQTVEMVQQAHPGWSAEECALEVEMLAKWDPATAVALSSFVDSDFTPEPVVPSLVQLADPSMLVSPEFADTLVSKDFEVRVVKGAEHTIHRHLFEDFMAGLEGWI
ncbi:alpha/beta hydrolase family protein [Microtetraspora sp. NBRC 16547]|uniref:alpha/beta fold hydrolase n=1 Tax=Microtetraspora sp. NBRC 16547 TaxID=3030993 RepID=UPI0024A5353F|nr:alpha/beta hydrolase family protein [Microtetraspora sp. NBRC 16547]GLW96757.1 alpha/beta hydrolase [Microtetraspora sp. NBRC 16547]